MKPHILIVDDQADIRHVLSVVLGRHFRLTEASDGLDAIAKLTQNPPDLVITDVQMPKMNGVQLVEFIRQNPATARIPVIAMSGYYELESRRKLDLLGIQGFLNKPFSVVEIAAQVREVLQHSPPSEDQT